jgi:hypothetical protein
MDNISGMDKDIHFTEKKVDESWKDGAVKESSKLAEKVEEAKKEREKTKTTPESQKKFINFLMGLASQALYLMSAQEGDRSENLEHAQELISILEILKERTANNLTEEEEKVFKKVLYEVQMQCVEILKSVKTPPPPKS